jgi:dihydrofolate reductase
MITRMISAIVAIDNTRGIALNNKIPWDIPQDRRYFKSKTLNKTVVMGYKTYQSIPSSLPRRQNLVLTSHARLSPGFTALSSTSELFNNYPHDFCVIGGQQVYEQLLPYVQKLFITVIDADFGCDRFFPEYKDQFTRSFASKKYRTGELFFWYEHWSRVKVLA